MPRQSNSTYQAPANTAAVSHAQIGSAAFNTLETDIGNEITNSLDRLGRGAMQADLPMGGHRTTGQAAGSATNDGATVNQAQSGVLSQAVSVSGVDTIVLTFAPQFPSLVAGTRIKWASAGPNLTTSSTVNADTLGAITLLRNGGSAVAPGDTGASGYECEAVYNGTNWLLMNPAALNVTASGNNAFTGNNTHAGNESFNGSMSFNEQTLTVTTNTAAWDMSLGPDAFVTNSANLTFALPTNIPAKGRGRLRVNNGAAGAITLTWNGAFSVLPNSGSLTTGIPPGITYFEWWSSGGTVYVSRAPMNGGLNYCLAASTTTGNNVDVIIPAWAQRITVMFNGVETNGTSQLQVQIGNGTPETTGYISDAIIITGAVDTGNITTGFITAHAATSAPRYGSMTLTRVAGGTTWIESSVIGLSGGSGSIGTGRKSVGSVVTILRVAPVNGTDAFNGNSIAVMAEG